MRSPLACVLLAGIRAYRYLLSPWVGNQCRFVPSCSLYAQEAVCLHGAVRGGILAALRIGKCHPWHPGGFDPVPGAAESSAAGSDKHEGRVCR